MKSQWFYMFLQFSAKDINKIIESKFIFPKEISQWIDSGISIGDNIRHSDASANHLTIHPKLDRVRSFDCNICHIHDFVLTFHGSVLCYDTRLVWNNDLRCHWYSFTAIHITCDAPHHFNSLHNISLLAHKMSI